MRGLSVFAAMLLALTLPATSFGQSTYATVSGTIEDPTRAVLPGVSVTARNNATGIVSTVVSNETGTYNITGLLPGAYTVSADLPGFQKATYTNITLGNAQQVRLNFTLQISAQAQSIEVTLDGEDMRLVTSSASVGEVLSQQRVQDLPIVGNNVLSFFSLMPGVRMDDNGVTGTFAGLAADKINIQRDGIDASAAGRYFQAGAQTATFVNPDLVGEVRIVVAPVDAEFGRGNGQVQFLTRSGTNQVRGTAAWFARNTALDANTWSNNRQIDARTGAWKPVTPDWSNVHQLTGSVGGPIRKNKTFFFTLYDHTIVNARTTQNPQVLTPCARNGIFRFFDGWNNGNAIAATQASGNTPTIAVVDPLGNPLTPATNPNASAFSGALRYVSVFGRVTNTPTRPDCSDAIVQAGSNWDTNRKALDPTGYVTKLIGKMPPPNNYEIGDGLNTAGHRWLRRESNGTESIFGTNGNLARKQINTKIDHSFNSTNKLGVSYTYENSAGTAGFSQWPGGFQGSVFRKPQTVSLNFVSTLSPALVNEARAGMRRTGSNSYNALTDPTTGKDAQAFLPNYAGYPIMLALTAGGVNGGAYLGGGGTATYLDTTTLWTFGDSLSWTKGKHAFKMGAEIRRQASLAFEAGGATLPTTIPQAFGGEAPNAPISTTAISGTTIPGLAGTATAGNNAAMRNLLNFLSGSLSRITEFRFMQNPTKLDAFENYTTRPLRERDFHGNEASIFVKDDWKVKKSLTLNLGVRWDYFGSFYETNGFMPAAAGGPSSIWGISGSSFADWMKPGVRGKDTLVAFFGKNSPNPKTPWRRNDYNNFGPAVGFAWQVPWFGAGKTTLRGGYQVTYQIGWSYNQLSFAASAPGSGDSITYTGDSNLTYLDLTKLSTVIPLPSPFKPLQPIPTSSRTQQIYQPGPGLVSPYTQNMTLSLTRSLSSNLTMDLRYVGTLSRKQNNNSGFNINVSNFLYNGLKEAFDAARAGGESPLLNQILNGINLGAGTVGVNGFSGAAALRADNRFNSNLANGNYLLMANTLNTLNYTTALNPTLPPIPAGVLGQVLKVNNFPDNFVVANPQFTAINMITNDFSSNYHSLEAQVTMRQTHGISMQSTYTWSKNLGTSGPMGLGTTYTNPVNRHADYSIQNDTRVHDFRTNGTFALPFGPGKALLGQSSGTLARIVEGWQAGWIVNLNSGAPLTVTGNNSLYGNGRPDLVGPFPTRDGSVTFDGTPAATGAYWKPGTFAVDKDPQCFAIATSLQSLCTLNAIKDAKSGQILVQNAQPGAFPTMGYGQIFGPGRWRFDANLSKMIKLTESKTLQFRLDAADVLNHPEPNTPSVNITGTAATNFGQIVASGATPAKTNLHRQLQAQLRFNF